MTFFVRKAANITASLISMAGVGYLLKLAIDEFSLSMQGFEDHYDESFFLHSFYSGLYLTALNILAVPACLFAAHAYELHKMRQESAIQPEEEKTSSAQLEIALLEDKNAYSDSTTPTQESTPETAVAIEIPAHPEPAQHSALSLGSQACYQISAATIYSIYSMCMMMTIAGAKQALAHRRDSATNIIGNSIFITIVFSIFFLPAAVTLSTTSTIHLGSRIFGLFNHQANENPAPAQASQTPAHSMTPQ